MKPMYDAGRRFAGHVRLTFEPGEFEPIAAALDEALRGATLSAAA